MKDIKIAPPRTRRSLFVNALTISWSLENKVQEGGGRKENKKDNSKNKDSFFKAAARLVKSTLSSAKEPRGAARTFLEEDEENESERNRDLNDGKRHTVNVIAGAVPRNEYKNL